MANTARCSASKPSGYPFCPPHWEGLGWGGGSRASPGHIHTCTLPSRAGGQRIPIEPWLTLVALLSCCVVQAAQAAPGQGIAVPHGIEVHVPMTLTGDAGTHGTSLPQGVPKKSIIAQLAALPCKAKSVQRGPAEPQPPPHIPTSPLCPGGQWVHTTSPLLGS